MEMTFARVYPLWIGLTLTLGSLACSSHNAPASPAEGYGQWEDVQGLSAGVRVVVLIKPSGRHEGVVRAVTAGALTVVADDTGITIARDTVLAVVRCERPRWTRARIGFGVGALLAGSAAAIVSSEPYLVFRAALTWGLIGMGIGAGGGRDTLIYAAPDGAPAWHPPHAMR